MFCCPPKNTGFLYVNKVHRSTGIYAKLAEKKRQTAKRQHYQNIKVFKKNTKKTERKIEKKNQITDIFQKELHEGTIFESGMAVTCISDVREIPGATLPLISENIGGNIIFKKVFCDIETTSLCKTCDIIQLAAAYGNEKFDKYIFTNTVNFTRCTRCHRSNGGGWYYVLQTQSS